MPIDTAYVEASKARRPLSLALASDFSRVRCACPRQNSRQVGPVRRGAGSSPAPRFRTVQTWSPLTGARPRLTARGWMRRYLRSRSPAETVAPRRGHSLSLRASRRLGLVWEGPTRDPVMVLLLGFAERHGDEQATLQSLRDAAIFEVTQRLTCWDELCAVVL